jgi:hypothetical protein
MVTSSDVLLIDAETKDRLAMGSNFPASSRKNTSAYSLHVNDGFCELRVVLA